MRKIILLACIFFTALYLHAYDWQAKGISVETESGTSGRKTTVLKKGEARIDIIHAEDINRETGDKLSSYINKFTSFNKMKTKRITFAVSSDSIEIVVYPSSFSLGGKDIASFIPAGLVFIETDILRYDFRLTVDSLFLRLKGSYITEADLYKRIEKALEDPAKYVKVNDLNYALDQIDILKDDVETLKSKAHSLENENDRLKRVLAATFNKNEKVEYLDKLIEIKKANPSISVDDIRNKLKGAGIRAKKSSVEAIMLIYFGE